ncbi:hypothetical protein AHAS_Ahas16G0286800 [Arachis hypogaea]
MGVQEMVAMFLNTVGHGVGNRMIQESPSDQPKFIGRKRYPTQNIMAVCDWDMCFIFTLSGWEGTAHDARVFDNAITTPTMNFSHPPPD